MSQIEHWIKNFTLFLFDFDGLLVNTEKLHFEAYRKMCQRRGVVLPWTLTEFFERAHFTAEGLREALYTQFPQLYEEEPCWEVLYEEKKQIYQELLEKGELELMPGVAPLLKRLETEKIKRCVVTNSWKIQVDEIKKHLPLLDSIPLWLTRECYERAKPDPDGYQTALKLLAEQGDVSIGFEDSMRGLCALIDAKVDQAVLISPWDYPQMRKNLPVGIECYSSF